MNAKWVSIVPKPQTDTADMDVTVLIGKISHSFILDHNVLFSEFQKAVHSAYKNDQKLANPNAILRKFEENCNRHLKNKIRYTLITSIGLNSASLPRRRHVNGCVLNFSKNVPKNMLLVDENCLRSTLFQIAAYPMKRISRL